MLLLFMIENQEKRPKRTLFCICNAFLPSKSFFFDAKSFEVVPPQTTLKGARSPKVTFFAKVQKDMGQSVGETYLAAILKMTQMSTLFAGWIAKLAECKREK